MLKIAVALMLVALSVAACGGGSGGDGSATTPTAKTMKLSLYGQPLVNSPTATAHVQSITHDASAPVAASDANASVLALQDALTARGVPADVTAQVMDGTTLHQIVMGENNGLPPTADQFKTDPSGYLVVNFQLDDMATPWTDPNQAAAVTQFAQDLTVFSQRAAVSGKLVYAVLPLPKCNDSSDSARSALISGIVLAQRSTLLNTMGSVPFCDGSHDACVALNGAAYSGADCSTSDSALENTRTNAIADYIAALYKDTAAAPASGASATGT
jgi:hypothetical protein